MSAITTPVSSKSTCATNKLSPSPEGIGESQLTTATPASVAASTPDWICSPALFEIMTASTPCVAAFVIVSICPVGSSHVAGARNSGSDAPSSAAASCAPSLAWSNTAMPVHTSGAGSTCDVVAGFDGDGFARAGSSSPSAGASVSSVVSSPDAASSSSSSPPHAATPTSARLRNTANSLCRLIPFLLLSLAVPPTKVVSGRVALVATSSRSCGRLAATNRQAIERGSGPAPRR